MSLFQSIVDQLPAQTGALGAILRFVMPRDYAREGFVIVADYTVNAAAATAAAEGQLGLIKRVRLTGNDGGQNRDLVNADALSICQRHVAYNNSLDTPTLLAQGAGNTTGAKTLRIPFLFPPGSIEDPTRSLFLANFPRFNNDPILEISIATQADMDGNATPTFALTGTVSIYIVDLKRYVSTNNWNFLKTDFVTYEQAYTINAAAQRYNIPVPGWHFAIGMRSYSAAATLGDISQAGGFFKIQALNVVERLIQTRDLNALNTWSVNSDVTAAGVAGAQRNLVGTSFCWWDYLTDLTGSGVTNLDTLLNSNPYVALGTAPQVIGDINGAAGKKIIFMHDRCYGDIAPALLAPTLLKK